MQQTLEPSIEFTVAVVEDDEDIRINVCRFLTKSGLHAWGTDSAEDFYIKLLREKADLVVVDLGLPARWYDRVDVPFPARAAVELPDQMQIDPVEALRFE